ncbi:MAG: hypothetical protein A2Y38_24040 [Spirochaetes bacterium GWB1_59_5]|nr:MAG: hypothetical protein A2Y38_24040 [Spirochaetes bacterium GWB1_59_5]
MKKSKHVKTLDSKLSSAELCRRNGWGPGTKLKGTERGEGWERESVIRIMRVTPGAVLGVCVMETIRHSRGKSYQTWTLTHREWRKVKA